MAWNELSGDDVHFRPSPHESERFGLSIARVTCGIGAGADVVPALTSTLREATEDVVVVRYPAEELALGAAVLAAGRVALPAGALSYWGAPVDNVLRPGRTSGIDVVPISGLETSGDHTAAAGALREVVADAFEGYGSHYLANPALDPSLATHGYQEWAARSVEEGSVLVLRLHGEPIGLATYGLGDDHLEILLAGLVPAAQGEGRYGVLIGACADLARREGKERVIISGQVHNVRAQRAWVKAGLRPFAAVETVHAVRQGLIPTS